MMVVGLPGLLLAYAIWVLMPEPRRGLSDVARKKPEEEVEILGMWQGFLEMARNPIARYVVVGATLTAMVGYSQTGWGPSYMQRSLGMTMLEVANYVAVPAALVAGASTLIGGALADRMAARYGLHTQPWVIAGMKLIAFPFAIAFYFVKDVPLALGAYFVSVLAAGAYLGPTFALVQHLAPLRRRALWAAVTQLTMTLIGLGLGPLLVGQVSDWLQPAYGADSLRIAMLSMVLLGPVSLFCYWRAGVLMKREAASKAAQQAPL